jgi:phenylpyruvate tautomerase PptA (4-oxalocrotonate tautomerase family)
VPAEAVEIIIYEISKDNWGVGGGQASEKLKQCAATINALKNKKVTKNNG